MGGSVVVFLCSRARMVMRFTFACHSATIATDDDRKNHTYTRHVCMYGFLLVTFYKVTFNFKFLYFEKYTSDKIVLQDFLTKFSKYNYPQ